MSKLADQVQATEGEVRAQLGRLLASPAFHSSKRCQQFLEYVCERSLSHAADDLKERTIAIEVFGRHANSEMGDDTIVRVSAREVRKRLAQYYVSAEGADAEIRIDLPSGCYAPEFRYRAPHSEPQAPVAAPAAGKYRLFSWTGSLLVLAMLVFLCTAGALAYVYVTSGPAAERASREFHKFWAPVFDSQEPLLVAVAHPIVYHPSARLQKRSAESLPSQENPLQRPVPLTGPMDGSDLIPVFNQYVGFGDLVAANEVTAMLAHRNREVRVRMASAVEFADFRNAPALLIGAVTNRWTMEFQQGWRFQFLRTGDFKTVIRDTMGPEHREWSIPMKPDGSALEDYILVCRIRNSLTGKTVMLAAGLKQFGTEAAGRFLAEPAQLDPVLKGLPAGWEWKNLQVILHAKVIRNSPAYPEVVASHVW